LTAATGPVSGAASVARPGRTGHHGSAV